ncbi:hypothetical protein DZF91_10020 [Actinomadura logoneensis]|uniref:DUF2269 family protein n=1 Tax=Actinomadura logoneensis TaxID=2293572 RepID=A0A372JP32_9ACTN|nr:hypothetical protein [Actinomadura logoneensis]RFU41772.1 hypothetical protein DZF91_10020 [Actinomadura logoneensis]
MSSSDRLLLILHIGFAIFTLGPLTAATMSTPRYIRRRDVAIVKYLNRTTMIYAFGSLGVFLFGLFLAKGQFARFWLSASMTLFVVGIALLFLVERDQRKAIRLLEVAAAAQGAATVQGAGAGAAVPEAGRGPDGETATGPEPEAEAQGGKKDVKAGTAPADGDVAAVERGRIAAFSGVIALIWLVILVMMVWH